MTSKQFIIRTSVISLLLVCVMVFINYSIDLYGLFHATTGKSISIYSDERTAKYLLAHRYVPENFDGYVLGPSLSANLDTKQVSKYKIYNLSMMGANITEQKAVVDAALAFKYPKFVLLCLHPYLTVDHGMKTTMINPKEYYGALGSFGLYKTYAIKIIRVNNLMPSKYPADQYNDYGYNNYNNLLQTMPVEDKINEQLQREDAIKATIDTVAWKEFNEMVDDLARHDVKIIGYFHPLPYLIFDKFREPLEGYQHKVEDVLKGKATIINFNSPGYEFFTKDLTNYIDHGHLSDKGQQYLLPEILKQAGM